MQLFEKMREIREARKLSQEAVAINLGISTNAYAKIERGESDISISRLQQIANVLGVKEYAFFLPESAITIMGDVKENTGISGVQHNQINDFEKEREAYKLHITSQENRIGSLEKQLNDKQNIIDKLLSK